MLASQYCTLGKKTTEGWIKVEHIIQKGKVKFIKESN